MKWTEIIKDTATPETPEEGLPFIWIQPSADFDLREFLAQKTAEITPENITVLTDEEAMATALILAEQGDGTAADASCHIFLIMGGNLALEGGDGSADALSDMVFQIAGGAGIVAAVRKLEEASRATGKFEDIDIEFEDQEELLDWLHKQRKRARNLRQDR